jgi:hypothetical protein
MTDHQITILGLLVSFLAMLISYLALREGKKTNSENKAKRLWIAAGKINELILPLKKLIITNVELLTVENLEQDKLILRTFIDKLRAYRKDIAEFPNAISNNILLLEASATKMIEMDVDGIDIAITNYEYDRILQALQSFYLNIYLITNYLCSSVLPDYVNLVDKANIVHLEQTYDYFKELATARADKRWISLKADMENATILLNSLQRFTDRKE